jgi:hypothetical protein
MQVVVRRKVRRVNAMVFSCAWDQLEYHVLDRSAPRVKLEQLLEMPQNNTAATSAAIHNRDSTRPDAGRVYLVDPQSGSRPVVCRSRDFRARDAGMESVCADAMIPRIVEAINRVSVSGVARHV